MEILVFKTDIQDPASARPVLDAEPGIRRWTIDTEDADCILRIEGTGLAPETVITRLSEAGFRCAELPD